MLDRIRQWPDIPAIEQEIARRAVSKTQALLFESGTLALSDYIRLAWHAVEPARQYVHGWMTDAICEHLEAVLNGQITRLGIAVPPGSMKSLTTCVFFPSFVWGPAGLQSHRFLGFSYDVALSTRDALRCRRLMQSPWYQQLWGERFKLLDDQNQKTRYENDKTGFRISDYVGGGTGERGDILIVDDPHRVKDPESDLMRERALLWLHETMPTRLTDPAKSAIIIIHHRLHERDMLGETMASDMGFEYLTLPMEFEPDRRCVTSLGFKDPRKEEGELLFPERFPREVVDRDKKAMGAYAVAGQFQQNPAPRGGGMIKRHWFEIVGAVPADCTWVRYWDLAASMDAGAYTAGVCMGRSRGNDMFYIRDIVRDRIDGNGVKRLIAQTAAVDMVEIGKRNYRVYIPQDPGQAGKAQVQDLIMLLAGYDVHAERETGDKETRARPFAAQAEAGNVKLLAGGWNSDFLDECSLFPAGRYKDQVDACSGAFSALILYPKQRLVMGTIKGQI